MGKNIERLGTLLMRRVDKTIIDHDKVVVEMGTINSNMSLTPDSLPVDIPQGDYLVLAGHYIEPGYQVIIVWIDSEPIVLGTVE